MSEIFNNIISGVGITDVIDVAIVAFVIYKVLGFIRETRALQLVKGLLILVLATVLSDKFNLYTFELDSKKYDDVGRDRACYCIPAGIKARVGICGPK